MSCFINCEASVTKNIQAASEGPIWDDLRQDLYRVQDTITITSEEYKNLLKLFARLCISLREKEIEYSSTFQGHPVSKVISCSVMSDSLWPMDYSLPGSSLSMEFSRQEYWSELAFPSPEDLPNPVIKPGSPALQTDSLPLSYQGSPCVQKQLKNSQVQKNLDTR